MGLFSRKKTAVSETARVPDSPDGFACSGDDPLASEHGEISVVLLELVRAPGKSSDWYRSDCTKLTSAQRILDHDSSACSRYVPALIARLQHSDEQSELVRTQVANPQRLHNHPAWQDTRSIRFMLFDLLERLLRRKLPMPAETLHRLIDWCLSARRFSEYEHPMSALVEAVERLAEMEGRTPEIIAIAARTRHILDGNWQVDHRRRKLIARLEQIEDDSPKIPLESGEAWSDMARQDIAQTTGQQFQAWLELLTACRDAASAAPSTKWIKAARSFITQIGEAALRSALLRWFLESGSNNRLLLWCPPRESVEQLRAFFFVEGLGEGSRAE